jgi:Na+/glutamate symporter
MSKIASSLLSSSSSQQEQQEQEQIEEQREEEEEEDILINTGSTTITDILQVLKISFGIGLFVGGMADAFLPGPSGTFFTGLIIRDWTICVRARRFNRKKFSDERGG